MNKIDAFLVVEAEAQQDGKWIVRGRAYIDIRIGDLLYIEASENDTVQKTYLEFRVEYITSYRRETPILSGMMTGDITVIGQNCADFKNIEMMYKIIE